MTKLAMIIDLRKCIGCETCKHVCAEMHEKRSPNSRRRILKTEPNPTTGCQRIFLPIHCMHCAEPYCLDVCPSGATKKLADGSVIIDSDLCIGCGACISACPFDARHLSHQDSSFSIADTGKNNNHPPSGERIGVCTKCDFCHSLVAEGISRGLKPGSTPDATPLCVTYCLAEALCFGDLEDDASPVSQRLKKNRVFRLKEDFDTQPSVYYIMDDETGCGGSSSELVDLVATKKHDSWEEAVAVNFMLSGAGAGSYGVGYYLNQMSPQIPESNAAVGAIASVLLVIIGFALVWLGGGRHSSAVHSLRNIASSWISREILFGVLFIAAAVANLFFPVHIFQAAAVLSAAGMLVSQGYILNIYHSMAKWSLPVLPAFIFLLGLHSGYGVTLMIYCGHIESAWFLAAGVLINLLALLFWFIHGKAASGKMRNAAAPIEGKSRKTRIIITIGHIAPVVLLAICGLMHDQYSGVGAYRFLVFAAGAAMFAVSALHKAAVVLGMQHEAGLALQVDRCRRNVEPSDRYAAERDSIACKRLFMRPSVYFRDKKAQ